jgi:LPXTG-motif cell wall-anchored protein
MLTRRAPASAVLLGVAVVSALACTSGAGAAPAHRSAGTATVEPALHGTINGFASGDFSFLDALSVPSLNLTQASIAQSAAGVSSRRLQTADLLGQQVLAAGVHAKTSYGHGAGFSVNLGQPDGSLPRAALTRAEATAPRPSHDTSSLLTVPAGPAGSATVQPDSASADTTSTTGYCVLGKPLSEGTSTVSAAQLLPVGSTSAARRGRAAFRPAAAGSGAALLSANGTVTSDSTETLAPNGHGAFGLSSESTLRAASFTLFQGIAPITIRIVDPLVLRTFAGGLHGSAKVTLGGTDGRKHLLSVTAGGTTTMLSVDQVLGGDGATIPIVGTVNNRTVHLLNIVIGGLPKTHISADGRAASAFADLVRVQVINRTGPAKATIGGPLSPVLTPVLTPALSTLDSLVSAIQPLIEALGLTRGVDLRIAHFEARAQVPAGGVHCAIPVSKTATPDPVTAGHSFVYRIDVQNPYDCALVHVRVADRLDADNPGVHWHITGTDPTADSVHDTHVVYDDVGPIPRHSSKQLRISVAVDADSAPGRFTDHAVVTAECRGAGVAADGSVSNADLTGRTTVAVPRVAAVEAVHAGSLPNTGGSALPAALGTALAAFAGVGLVLRRRTRVAGGARAGFAGGARTRSAGGARHRSAGGTRR